MDVAGQVTVIAAVSNDNIVSVQVSDARAGLVTVGYTVRGITTRPPYQLTLAGVGRLKHVEKASGTIGTLTASGGDGRYRYTLPSGSANRFALSGSGNKVAVSIKVSTLTAGSEQTLTVQVAGGDKPGVRGGSRVLRVSILSSVALAQQATPLTVVRGLTRGAVLTVSATGGDGAYTYTLISDDNNVVAPVANNRAVVSLQAVDTTAGRLMVTLSAEDTYSQATIVVTLDTVAPVSFVPSSLVVGVETTQATGLLLTAAAQDGGLPYTYTLLATTPDANEKAKLSLYADGKVSLKARLSGFPVTAKIQVQDHLALRATLTVIIWDNLRADVSGYWATVGVGHTVVVASVRALSGKPPFRYTVVHNRNRFTVDAAGQITVIAAVLNNNVVSVQVSDARAGLVTVGYTVRGITTRPPYQLTLAGVGRLKHVEKASGTIGTLTASGGDGRYRYTLPSGSANRFALSGSGNKVAVSIKVNTLAAGSEQTLTVQVAGGDKPGVRGGSRVLRVSILSSVALAQQATPLTVVRGLTRGAVLTVSATGGDGAYTYALVSDDNNVVATVANNRAVLSLQAVDTTAGRLMVTLSADDSYSQATIVVTVDTVAPVSFVPSSLVVGVETTQATGLLLTAAARDGGLPYTYTLLATTPDANEKAKLSLYADGKVIV